MQLFVPMQLASVAARAVGWFQELSPSTLSLECSTAAEQPAPADSGTEQRELRPKGVN